MLLANPVFSPINGIIKDINKNIAILSAKEKLYKNIVYSPVNGIVSYIEIIKGKWLGKDGEYKNLYVEFWIQIPQNNQSLNTGLISISFELSNLNIQFFVCKGDTVKEKTKLCFMRNCHDITINFRNAKTYIFEKVETYHTISDIIATIIT